MVDRSTAPGRLRKGVIGATIAALAACAAMAFLFRHASEDNPPLGRITLRYRWGRPALIEVDGNYDGVIDMRARVPGTFATGVPPVEWWEVPCGRHTFRYHVTLREGQIASVETDEGCTGTATARYDGADARAFYDDRIRPLPLESRVSRRE